MKKIITILIISIFTTGSSFGQKSEPIEDSVELLEFNKYVHCILTSKKDSVFPDSLFYKYKMVYMTSCGFSESLRLKKDPLYQTWGKAFILDSDSLTVKDTSINHNFKVEQNNSFLCAENPRKLVEELSFPVLVKYINISDSLEIRIIDIENLKTNFFDSPPGCTSGISFKNAKYLVVEYYTILSLGNQTSGGTTRTFFLEKIE